MSFDPKEVRNAGLFLMGAMTAASDQAQAMSVNELIECLVKGRWTTIEVHEATRRLALATNQIRADHTALGAQDGSPCVCEWCRA